MELCVDSASHDIKVSILPDWQGFGCSRPNLEVRVGLARRNILTEDNIRIDEITAVAISPTPASSRHLILVDGHYRSTSRCSSHSMHAFIVLGTPSISTPTKNASQCATCPRL